MRIRAGGWAAAAVLGWSGCSTAAQPTAAPVVPTNERRMDMAAEAAAAASRAQAREAAEDAALRGLQPKANMWVGSDSPQARAVQAALDVGDPSAAESALARWVEAGVGATDLREARAAITAVKDSQHTVSPYRAARWLQGRASGQGTDLIVAWEMWCPHCRRHMPLLQQTADTWGNRGLHVVGVTTLSRGTAEGAARKFLADEGITFANAVVPASALAELGAAGVPHAYLVVDGRLRWQGHPAEVTDALLRRWAH